MDQFDASCWDRHYASATSSSGSSRPRTNAHVVALAEGLAPGAALDVGCGEGGDALWLASRGWRVTAVDVSSAVLDRARARAAAADPSWPGRVSWVRADVVDWPPRTEGYDLVSAQYVHVPDERLGELADRLRDAVAPGGTLVVADHAHGARSGQGPPDVASHPLTAAVLASLSSPGWVVRSGARPARDRDADADDHVHAHDVQHDDVQHDGAPQHDAPDHIVIATRADVALGAGTPS